MRYVLGPAIEYARPDPVPTPKADTVVTIAGTSETSVSLAFERPTPDVNFPAELRIYLAMAGSSVPATADEWVASEHPVSVCQPIDSSATTCDVATPEVGPGSYLLQVVVGYLE